MSRIAYVNGRYLAHRDARVHIEDRGYQFADGCYEVVAMKSGVFIDAGLHLQRLRRSLAALSIAFSMNNAALMVVMNEVGPRHLVRDGFVYQQITRGVPTRGYALPRRAQPNLVLAERAKLHVDAKLMAS